MLNNYRLEINKLDNGYTVRRDNDNPPSKVFITLESLLEYIKYYFSEVKMKKFEKWARQNMYDRTETKKAWKAALEWALSLNSVRIHNDVYEDIKKELNG